MQIECEEECERRDAFQDGNFDAGGVRFEVRDRFPAIEIGGTRDAFPARHLYPRRMQFWKRDTFQTGTLGRKGVKLERDTFQSGILE